MFHTKGGAPLRDKQAKANMATALGAPKLSFSPSAFHTIRRKFPISLPLKPHSADLHTFSFNSLQFSANRKPFQPHRRFVAVRAESDNGAEAKKYDFDLFTIGAGSGGVRASRFAASYGASVAVCELPFATVASESTGGVGGTRGFGWSYETDPKHDWSTLMANKNAELQRLTGIYKNLLKNAGVTLLEGRGKVVGPHTVDVDGKLYTAKHIIISVGGRPFIPDIPGSQYAIDSDAALDLPSKPDKIAIIGGGYIAVEFAGIFNGLKSEVHVFIRQKQVLRGFDEEPSAMWLLINILAAAASLLEVAHSIRDFVGEQMSLRGIEFHTEETPQAIQKSSDGLLSLKTNRGTVDGFSHVMFATGRRPNTQNLGLEAVGVKMAKNGAIEVDEYSRTSVDSIWAVGDVTDRINLTPVALMEGGALAKTVFGNEPMKPDYRVDVKDPSKKLIIDIRGVQKAIQKYGDIDVYTANFRPLKATLSGLPDRVLMKVIACAKTNKVLGVHMCGEDSPEIIQGIAIAVKAGLTKADFDATVGIHPTSSEEFVTLRNPTRKVRNSSQSEFIFTGIKLLVVATNHFPIPIVLVAQHTAAKYRMKAGNFLAMRNSGQIACMKWSSTPSTVDGLKHGQAFCCCEFSSILFRTRFLRYGKTLERRRIKLKNEAREGYEDEYMKDAFDSHIRKGTMKLMEPLTEG
ncbi:hypothetical protein ACLOJK_032834 [Asimina triloba]